MPDETFIAQCNPASESWVARVARSYGRLVRAIDAPLVGDAAARLEQESLLELSEGHFVEATRKKLGAFREAFAQLIGR